MAGKKNEMSFSHIPNNTNSRWWQDPCLRINVLHCTGLYFCVFYLGYDASLLNGLQAMGQWNNYFNKPSGNLLGLISSSLFLPAIITPYIAGYISDRHGRKITLAIGSCVLIAGAFVNAFAKNLGTFIAGRVLIGAAGPFGKITAVALLHEIAHPRLRPIVATSFYSNYYVGSIASAWFCYGSLHWGPTDWSWRAPCLFQIMAPLVVLVYLIFIPESPRYLIRKGKVEKAMQILTKYHANGDPEDKLVAYEYQEICHAIQLEEENKRTKYSDFVKTPGNRRRLLVLLTLATGTNWIGNSIISYYLAPVLELVGITDYGQISGINGGLAVWNLFLAYAGSLNAESVGRRRLFLISTIGMLASYIVITGLSGGFAATQSHSVGIAVVPFLFIYYGFYDIGWHVTLSHTTSSVTVAVADLMALYRTPLPFSYSAEILPYHMRLKGLGILLSVQSVAQAFNQWVNPVALDALQWKYYFIYLALQVVYLVLIVLFFPETRRLTIEEVSLIFDTGRLGNASAAVAEFQENQKDSAGVRANSSTTDKEGIQRIEPKDI